MIRQQQLLPMLTTALLILAMPSVEAQDYEITPLVGWRSNSSLEETSTNRTIHLEETNSYGVILSTKRDAVSNYDLLFTRQNTETRSTTFADDHTEIQFDHLQVGGTSFYHFQNLQPFLSGGLGITHISPSNDKFSSETKFSFSLGGGLLLPFTENIGLRLEARGYGIVVNSNGGILCTGGGCIAHIQGNFYMQYEASAGLSVSF